MTQIDMLTLMWQWWGEAQGPLSYRKNYWELSNERTKE